jgi:site-specific DNA recombinase
MRTSLLKTSDREYCPEDNAIISYVDFGMADQYSRDLSKNVKRGLRKKSSMVWRNGQSPLGYLNTKFSDRGSNYIIKDPERFDLVQKFILLFLESNYSTRQLLAETKKWGLTTRRTKRQGGKHLVLSHIYRALTDPFYAGWYYAYDETKGEVALMKGQHEAMITLEQFDRIQLKLGRKGKPRPHEGHFRPFNGKTECSECTSMVTTDNHPQLICTNCKYKFAHRNRTDCPKCATRIDDMENPECRDYGYYTCTKKKGVCLQKAIPLQQLEKMIDNTLANFQLSEAFTKWALEVLADENAHIVATQNAVITSQQDRYKKVVAQIQNLTLLFTSVDNANYELLTADEYAPQRRALLEEKGRLEDARQETGRKVSGWVNWAENAFSFATSARLWFEKGIPQQRKDIFYALSGSNFLLKDKQLLISLTKPLDFFTAIALQCPNTKAPLELTNGGLGKGDYLPFENDIPVLRKM